MKLNHARMFRLSLGIFLVAASDLPAQPGTKVWEYTTGDAVLSSPALTAGGVLYVGSYDQSLHAVNTANGTLIWKFPVDPAKPNQAGYVYSSPAVAPDGTVYFGTEERNFSTGGSSGNLFAVNSSGTLKWKFPVGASIYSDPTIASDGTIYFGCFDTYLYAVNPNGTLKWKFKAADTIFSDAAEAADGTVYFGCDDHNLYALSPGGTKKWTFDTGGPITAAPVIGADGTVYIGATSSLKFYALNPNGSKKWEFQTSGRIYSSAALGAEGTIYFGSDDSNLYAVRADGSLKWQFPTGGGVRSSPAVAADGTVYFGCEDGKLYAVTASGTGLWSFATAKYIYSSPVIGPNGMVYVGSADLRVYAIGGSSALASTAWPMLHHDPLHTGRAVAVTSADTPPTISNIPSQTIAAGGVAGPLAFTVGDAETAAANLNVTGASSNPTLVPQGNISFGGSVANRTVTVTPASNQTGSATITITVTDGGGNSAASSFLFTVSPTFVNHPPTLDPISDRTIDEGFAFSFTATASDPDKAQTLAFSLSSAPPGAVIDSKSGLFTWTPTETQGPGTDAITVVVTDSGGLSASQNFLLQVREVNSAPILQPVQNRTIQVGTALDLTAIAGDADLPANRLTFSLINPPVGAQIDSASGALTWTPTASQANTTSQITIAVTDDGAPSLNTQMSFNVAVVDVAVTAPLIQSVQISDGRVALTWSSLSGKTYRVQYTSDLSATAWSDLSGDIRAQGSSTTKTDDSGIGTRRFYRVILLP